MRYYITYGQGREYADTLADAVRLGNAAAATATQDIVIYDQAGNEIARRDYIAPNYAGRAGCFDAWY